MDIVIASNNAHKIKEIKQILACHFDNIHSLQEVGIQCDPKETGSTFLENARIKATEVAKHTQLAVLADDTGLCVHALNNAPGINSARYAGNHDNKANRNRLQRELAKFSDRSAHFECVVVLQYPDGTQLIGNGRVNGTILPFEEGDKAFGYDCIFYCDDLGKSFGIATEAEKNTVSHRARALYDLLSKIN